MSDSLSRFKKNIENIEIPEEKLDLAIQNGIRKASSIKTKNRFLKRTTYILSAAIVFFGILISSSFVSPVMASVLSKIPYLNLISYSQPIGEVIYRELEEDGYPINSSSVVLKGNRNVLEIKLGGSKAYYYEKRDDVENKIQQILDNRGYNDYVINVERYTEGYQLNNKEKQEKESIQTKLDNKIKAKYAVDMIQVDPSDKEVFINVTGSSDYYKDSKENINNEATKLLGEKYKNYKIKVSHVDVKIKKATDQSIATSIIAEGLKSKDEFKVTKVSYKNNPLTFKIYTSFSDNDPNGKEAAYRIEDMVNSLLTGEKDSNFSFDRNSYSIMIYNKEHQQMNIN